MKINQPAKSSKSMSQNDRARMEILKKLFGELDEKEVWNAFPDLLRGNRHPSVETLKRVRRAKRKIERRIKKSYRSERSKLHVILHGDVKLMHHVIQTMWEFSDSHEAYAKDAVVLRGSTTKKLLLDLADLAAISLLLWYTKKASDDSPLPDHVTD